MTARAQEIIVSDRVCVSRGSVWVDVCVCTMDQQGLLYVCVGDVCWRSCVCAENLCSVVAWSICVRVCVCMCMYVGGFVYLKDQCWIVCMCTGDLCG